MECLFFLCCFFFNDTATTEIYTLSLHDALPIFLPFFLVQAWVVVGLSFINSLLFEPIFAIWSPRLISALLVTGIAATFIAILLMIWAQQILNPSETAIIFSLEPVFATVFAIIFAGEILGLWGYIGGGLIVLAVAYGELG